MSIFEKLVQLRGTNLKSPLSDKSMEMLGYDPSLLPVDKRQAEICRFILLGWEENFRAGYMLLEFDLITEEEMYMAELHCRQNFS